MRDNLSDTHGLSLRTDEELANLSIIKKMTDREVSNIFNSAFHQCSEENIYYAIACELSTLWVDVAMFSFHASRRVDPVSALVDVLGVLLWINIFPVQAVFGS